MTRGEANHRFGIYWLFFGYTLALHVLDEAAHDFLSVYNPNAAAIRRAIPWLPVPIFTLQQFIGALCFALVIWLALAPLAFRNRIWLKRLAVPVGALAGIGNGLAHIASPLYMRRLMPGVYSAPLILLSGLVLMRSAVSKPVRVSAAAGSV
jgi:hypothetical protein